MLGLYSTKTKSLNMLVGEILNLYTLQGCDLTKVNNPEQMGCLILEDLQTLHIPTNEKLDIWTQCRLVLYFLGGYFSSFKNSLRQREICKKNPETSQA